jgi:hypothetical protein
MALLQGLNEHRARKFQTVLKAKAEMLEEAAKAKAAAAKARSETCRKQVTEPTVTSPVQNLTKPPNAAISSLPSKPITCSGVAQNTPVAELSNLNLVETNVKNSHIVPEVSVKVSPDCDTSQDQPSKSNAIFLDTVSNPSIEPNMEPGANIVVQNDSGKPENNCVVPVKTERDQSTNEMVLCSKKSVGETLLHDESPAMEENSKKDACGECPSDSVAPNPVSSAPSNISPVALSSEATASPPPKSILPPSSASNADVVNNNNKNTVFVKSDDPHDDCGTVSQVAVDTSNPGIGPSTSLKAENPVSGSATTTATEVLKVQ